jgi:hypothetical protein
MASKRTGSQRSMKNPTVRSGSGIRTSKSRAISPVSGGSAYGPTYVRQKTNIPQMKKVVPTLRGKAINNAMLTSKISSRSGAISQTSQKSVSSNGSRARVIGQFGSTTQPPNLNPMSILASTKKPSNPKYT